MNKFWEFIMIAGIILIVGAIAFDSIESKDAKYFNSGMVVHIKDTTLNATILGRPTDTYRCWSGEIYLCRIDHGESSIPRYEVVPFNKSDLEPIKQAESDK